MNVSIVVCSFNRADSLSETLDALQLMEVPEDISWEVIVVDNNSTDHTHDVVTRHAQTWPRLRYEFEQAQGLSHARNRGIAVAQGEIVLFTDDDVLPEPDWLVRIVQGMERHGADACGGYIAPVWEVPPPKWLTERFYGFLAVRTDRDDEYPIEDPKDAPYGANMAIRKTVFAEVGGFDTGRGRKGKVLASGEDGEMFERILDAGFSAIFLGGARVHHKVEAFRTTKQYIRRWRFQTSRNIAISRDIKGERRLFNIPLYLFPQLWRAVGRTMVGYIKHPADEAFRREVIVWHFLGLMRGLYSGRKGRA